MELSKEEQVALKESELLRSMAESEGYQEVFRPFLMAKLQESFPDPAKFTNDNDFTYAAKVTSVFKKVVAEILGWVDGQGEQAKYLRKKEKGEIKDGFQIGGE